MLLPNYGSAIIDVSKLTKYCLNEFHPKGKHKARVFKSVLNISVENASYLKDIIQNGIRKHSAAEQGTDKYGRRYTVDIKIPANKDIVTLRTNWIIKTNE